MKQSFIVTLIVLTFGININATETLPIEFSPNTYQGWNYSNPNVLLCTKNINGGCIKIYNDSKLGTLLLTSPCFTINNSQDIHVEFDWICNYYDQPEFSLLKTKPIVKLIDTNGKDISVSDLEIETKEYITSVSCTLDNKNVDNAYITISAPNADTYAMGIIKHVKVYNDNQGAVSSAIMNNTTVYNQNSQIIIENCMNQDISIFNIETGISITKFKSQYNKYETDKLAPGFYAVIVNEKTTKIVIY